MGDEKEPFYVVRKGDVIGIYKDLTTCQSQAAPASLSDPSISVYKGYGLSKEDESYLVSHGLKQAEYSISASNLKDGLFGLLSVCPFQDVVGPSSALSNPEKKPVKLKNNAEPQVPITGARIESIFYSSPPNLQQDHVKNIEPRQQVHPAHVKNILEPRQEVQSAQQSCTIEFDGASKGNPGLAGAGAILRADDGCEVWRVREGVGIATNNVAEYRAVILGLRTALQKGYKRVRVRGDSQLVVLQIKGIWKTKNENMAILCKEAKELMNKFESFAIEHIAREFNSDADAQANRAINLRDGQVEMDVTGSHT